MKYLICVNISVSNSTWISQILYIKKKRWKWPFLTSSRYIFSWLLKQLIVKQRQKENKPLICTWTWTGMYRYVVTIAVHGESTISMFTKFFKIHFKKFGDEICIYMYICVTCNSDTRTLDQFCNKHVRFKQVIIHRILCVTLREQLHSRLSGDKKKKKRRDVHKPTNYNLANYKHCMEIFFYLG